MGDESKAITPLGTEYENFRSGKTPNTTQIVDGLSKLNQGCSNTNIIVLN